MRALLHSSRWLKMEQVPMPFPAFSLEYFELFIYLHIFIHYLILLYFFFFSCASCAKKEKNIRNKDLSHFLKSCQSRAGTLSCRAIKTANPIHCTLAQPSPSRRATEFRCNDCLVCHFHAADCGQFLPLRRTIDARMRPPYPDDPCPGRRTIFSTRQTIRLDRRTRLATRCSVPKRMRRSAKTVRAARQRDRARWLDPTGIRDA